MLSLNPVFSRELRSMHRGTFLYALRWGYVALLSGIVLVGWKQVANLHGVLPMSDQPNIPFDQFGALGRSLFEMFCWAELVLVALIGPMLTSRLLTEERERRTLEILQSSPLLSSQIISGKFEVGFFQLLLLLLSGLPVLGSTALLGGVSLGEIMEANLYLACLSMEAAAAGLLASWLARRTATAIILSYFLLGGICLLTAAPSLLTGLSGRPAPWTAKFAEGFWWLSPILSLMKTLNPSNFGPDGTISFWTRSGWLFALATAAAVTAIMLAILSARLRHESSHQWPLAS